jgi:hypothetical protein
MLLYWPVRRRIDRKHSDARTELWSAVFVKRLNAPRDGGYLCGAAFRLRRISVPPCIGLIQGELSPSRRRLE